MPREITPAQLADRLRSGRPTLLVDVREDWEREIAKIAGDVHIPMAEVVQRGAEFRPPEGGLTIIYCHAGVRSMRVADYLEQSGIPDLLSLAGGIDAWSWEVDPKLPRY